MPLFILAGELMNRGGVTKALIDVSMALVGHIRGGLGHVNIMTSAFLQGFQGRPSPMLRRCQTRWSRQWSSVVIPNYMRARSLRHPPSSGPLYPLRSS